MNLAVMQPCYLPWRGYFALMKMADVFIHLDDVPLPQGRTYQTRIAIKTSHGRQWLSVPVHRESNQLICDVQIVDDGWRHKHRRTLAQQLPQSSPLVDDVYERPWSHLAALNIALADRLADALDIHLCRATGATRYITGHGARNYFDHEAFEAAGVDVMYLDYDLAPYPQPHGDFDPFVSVLDVLAHAAHPADCIGARLVPWQEFLARTPTNHGEPAALPIT